MITADSMGPRATAISAVPLHARPALLENSVAVMSRRNPGVFYSMNDSDNEPLVFALDTTGADRGVWRVTNATNIDWESASLGPCGALSVIAAFTTTAASRAGRSAGTWKSPGRR